MAHNKHIDGKCPDVADDQKYLTVQKRRENIYKSWPINVEKIPQKTKFELKENLLKLKTSMKQTRCGYL